jgi:hypothetical protein
MRTAKENLQLVEDFSNFGYEGVRALAQLNLQTWEKLLEKQMDAVGLFLDTGIKQLNIAGEVKDAKSMTEAQIELTREFGESLVSKGRETLELTSEVGDEYRSFFESRIETFKEKASKAAEQAA